VLNKFVVQTEQALLERPLPKQLVDGLLVQNGMVMLVAKYGVGKSFVALDLALSIASGQPTFLGRPLRRSGSVVYVLAEGVGRFKLRLMAWKKVHCISRSLPFHWINTPVDLLDNSEVDALIEAIRPFKPALVVIDTLSRCLVGADENGQASMSLAVESLERIRSLQSDGEVGPAVLILHHTGASGKRERGSTVLPGGLDTQLFLEQAKRKDGKKYVPIKDVLKLSSSKQKDLDGTDKPITLRKHICELSEVEASGEPATSCVWLIDGTDLSPDPIIFIIQTQPGIAKNELTKMLGGNKAKHLKRLRELVSSGTVRMVPDRQRHRLFLAASSDQSASVVAASESGESLRDSHTGTACMANQSEPLLEPEAAKGIKHSKRRNQRQNRAGAASARTGKKNRRNGSARPSTFRREDGLSQHGSSLQAQ
jgi:hypothetical protein